MRALIIEDEVPAFRRLQKILEEVQPDLKIVEVIDSVAESVKWLRTHQAPDLIFMDIQLSDGLSFEIFDQVKITHPVIFTTAFDAYMLRAFKVNSIDYLLKPIKKEELIASLHKYEDMKRAFTSGGNDDINSLIQQIQLGDPKYKSRYLVKQGDKLISVETKEIAYFFTKNGIVYLLTEHGNRYFIDHSLDEVVQQLDPQHFYRANRQFIINFQAIKAVHKYHKSKLMVELEPPGEDKVTVSAEKASHFKAWLGDYSL